MRNLLLFFYSMYSCVAFAQDHFANIRKIGMEEGLSHYKVHSFYSEKDGMWIATADGLNFFDGYNWKYWKKELGHFDHKNIDFIQKDQNNNLWLFNAGKTGDKNNVQTISILNTNNGIVHSFEGHFGVLAPFHPEAIQNFFEDKQHNLYFFANDQIWRYSGDTEFELLRLPHGFEPNSIFSDKTFVGELHGNLVLVAPSGELIYTSDYHLTDKRGFQVIGSHQNFVVWQEGSPCMQYTLLADNQYKSVPFSIQREGNLNYSLVHFDEKRNHFWVFAEPNISLIDSGGNLLFQHETFPRIATIDNNGNLWIGKYGITILRPEEKKFKRYLYQDEPSLGNEALFHCRGIIEKNDNLYIGTYNGTQIIDLKTGNAKPIPEKLDLGFAILKDRDQHIWGAKRQVIQLDQFESNVLNTFANKTYQPRIWSLFEDIDGQIWIGGRGLFFIKKNEIKPFKKYNNFPELEHAVVLFFYQDRSGVIWVGSDDGLYQLDPKKGIIAGYGLNRKNNCYLPSNKFQHMYQDAKGIYWLATEDKGLLQWDKVRTTVQQFDKKNGFLSNNIYSVYEDDFGYLWLSSFNGLIQFEKESKSISIYTEEDGISDNEFNRISHFQAADGHLFFGGQNGVIGFHPKDFLHNNSKCEDLEFAIKHVTIYGSKEWRDTFPDGSKIDLTNLYPDVSVIDLEMRVSDPFWTDNLELHYTLQQLDNNGKSITHFQRKCKRK